MIGARSLSGGDPASASTSTLGLGTGPIMGGILGGIFAAWLALGGTRRVAGTAGALFAVLVVLAAWNVAQPSIWIVDVVLNEILGEGGELYSGLAVFLVPAHPTFSVDFKFRRAELFRQP